MATSSISWLAGLFVTSITINTALLKVIYDDKFAHPSLVSLFINSLLSVVGGFFIYILAGFQFSVAFICFNASSFFLMVYFTKKRTVYALELGEKLLVALKNIDLQITYILNEMYEGKNNNLTKQVARALRFILSELPNIIGLDDSDHPQLCVLIPSNHRFKVFAYERIESFRIEKIEELFRYGDNTVSIAGHAMNLRKMIVVNDLSDDKDENVKYWVRTFRDEPKEGAVLVYPILRGLASSDAEPIAILCVTSSRVGAFKNENTLFRILTYFSIKIEILQNCLDLKSIIKESV
jgi:hypothetical protein